MMKNKYFTFFFLICTQFLFVSLLLSCSKKTALPEGIEGASASAPKESLTMAVLYFEPIGSDASLNNLREDIFSQTRSALGKSRTRLKPFFKGVEIVEREQLNKILAELKLNTSAYIAAESANRVGKELEAHVLFYGGFFQIEEQIYVNGHLYRVETGELIASRGAHFRLDDDNAYKKGIQNLSDGIVQAIEDKKDVLIADLLFEKGRDAEQIPDLDKAEEYWRQALGVDSKHIPSLKKLGEYDDILLIDDKITVAMAPFETEVLDPKLKVLEKGLIDLLTTELSKSPYLKIVERQRLDHIREELKEYKNPRTSRERKKEIGKLLGASLLCYGSVTEIFGKVNIYADMWRVEHGTYVVGSNGDVKTDKFAKELGRVVKEISREISTEVDRDYTELISDIYYERGWNYEHPESSDNPPNYEKAKRMYELALQANENHEETLQALKRVLDLLAQ